MSKAIRPMPRVLPTAIPMIAKVPMGLLSDCDVEVSDGEPEDVEDVSMFPTVDSWSRKFTVWFALNASNLSVGTTSRYAHAGTAVSGLIGFGYLSVVVNSCLRKKQQGTYLDTETIERVQFAIHKDHLITPSKRKAQENGKGYHRTVSAAPI